MTHPLINYRGYYRGPKDTGGSTSIYPTKEKALRQPEPVPAKAIPPGPTPSMSARSMPCCWPWNRSATRIGGDGPKGKSSKQEKHSAPATS